MAPSSCVDISIKGKKKRKRSNQKKPLPLVKPPRIIMESKSKSIKKKTNTINKREYDGDRFKNTAESLNLIKQYHTLNKRLEQNARDDTISEEERKKNSNRIRQEQEELGGIKKYQQASMYGAKSSKFVCAKWVEPLLRKHWGFPKPDIPSVSETERRKRPLILDVGAIDNQYLQYDWIDAMPIDLNAQHASVVQADFFDYAKEKIEQQKSNTSKHFDAIVLSLVLNFQGDPRKRGDMLALAADDRLLKANGLLFIALPSASLDNSRYCDENYLIEICGSMGLKPLERKKSAKLSLLTFRRTTSFQAYHIPSKGFQYLKEFSRAPAKPGEGRNNFAIMLRNSKG